MSDRESTRDQWPEISANNIASFNAEGFLKIDRVLDTEGHQELSNIYDRIVEDFENLRPGMDCVNLTRAEGLLGVYRPELKFTELLEHPICQQSCRVAEILLNAGHGEVTPIFRLYHKLKKNGPEVPWHQDEAYRDPQVNYRCVTVWFPLDGADPEHGCLQFIPGSHRGEVVVHNLRQFGSAGESLLEALDVPETLAVTCPVPFGGATIHHVRTLHRSLPNEGNADRRVFAIACEAPGSRRQLGGTENPDWQLLRQRMWNHVRSTLDGHLAGGLPDDDQYTNSAPK